MTNSGFGSSQNYGRTSSLIQSRKVNLTKHQDFYNFWEIVMDGTRVVVNHTLSACLTPT